MSSIMKSVNLRWMLLVVGLVALVAGGWALWRYTAPVEVHLASTVNGLPFEIETIPPVVSARPGEVVKVIYRIRNNDLMPIPAYGQVVIEPTGAESQVQVFLTQCGGMNIYQNGYAEDYEVVFRVQAAGLTGASQITLQHIFTPAVQGSISP
jgi:cytochrome c oxidase assembly protein Cox11